MPGEKSGKELTWSFLLDAWDVLAGLEEGVKGLDTAASLQAARKMLVLAHRLKGSAGMFGFPETATVAAAIEHGLGVLVNGAGDFPGPVVSLVRDAHGVLQDILNGIALEQGEDVGKVAALRRRHPGAFAAAAPQAPPLPPPPGAAAGENAAPFLETSGTFLAGLPQEPFAVDAVAGVFDELHAFFDGNPDASFFGPEVGELLDTISGALLAARNQSDPASTIATLFRGFHTLKGSAYTVGCQPIGRLAHRVEDVLSAVRSGETAFDPGVERILFDAVDALRLMLPGKGHGRLEVETAHAGVLAALDERLSVPAPVPDVFPAPEARPAETRVPVDPPAPVPAPAPAPVPPRPASAFGATIRVRLERLDGLLGLASELTTLKGRLAQEFGVLGQAAGQLSFSRKRLDLAIREFETRYANPQLPTAQAAGGFSEIELERYDDFNILARAVGELNEDLAQAQLQIDARMESIQGEIETFGTSLRNLRQGVSRARLVAVGQLFGRFQRLARQREAELGKRISFEVRGETVELDNFILEQVSDPLLHLVQNALAHGIESPQRRIDLGKDPEGRIRLTAYSRGNRVWIEVEDDGAGMDPEALCERAVSLGLVSADAARKLGRREAIDLIYLPGFSTAASSTAGAGRGVGMDVVRTNILRLKGEIDVDTKPGRGTKFTLRVPLTLIVLPVLVIEVAGQPFALPMSAVETLLPAPPRTGAPEAEEVLAHGAEDLPVVRLRSVLGLSGTPEPAEPVAILMRAAGQRFFAVADAAVRNEDVVVKSLGTFLEGLSHLQGAALSGAGELILLLEPGGLLLLWRVGAVEGSTGAAAPEAARPAARLRILLVDDSISVRKVVARMLDSAGFEVETAVDGEDALERLRSGTFDVVVTDLEMPRINGYELIQQVRDRPGLRHLPIIVLTTRVGERHQTLALELGADGFLSKPVDESKLVGAIRRVRARVPAAGPG